MTTETDALLPCPNPWCAPPSVPVLCWTTEAYVACNSCGMEGPSVSPIMFDEDGDHEGTRDAEAEAIAAWNTRPDAQRVAKLEAALREIASPLDCGCVPCTGRCRSKYNMEIEVESRQDIARAALSETPNDR